jgi:selenide,water dikinase
VRASTASPIVKDLVLVGGGHAHVAVLKRFGMDPMPGVRVTLIARDVHTPYSGMLPGYVAGHYGFDDMHVDLGPLARFAGASLIHDEAIGLDLANRRVLCRERPPLAYDVLSLDIGATPDPADLPGADAHAVPIKPIGSFLARFEDLRGRVRAREGPVRIGVVGAGAAGVEIVLALRHRLRIERTRAGREAESLEFHLIGDGPELLPAFPAAARARMARLLDARGVRVHLGRRAVAVEAGRVRLADGAGVDLDEILLATPAGAASWPKASGLTVDERGFVQVDENLRSVSHPEVFATGDIAAMVRSPRPKAGVFAVRQGPVLAENLRRALASRPLRPFRPQRRYLAILSAGDRVALAVRGDFVAEGAWIWRWKDWIDRRWMRRYGELPAMPSAGPDVAAGIADNAALKEISAFAMRCGGCGAKVGGDLLARALEGLDPGRREEVLVGLDSPDDAAVVRVPAGKALVQTVDFFRAFVADPYVFAQVAANHALGDIHAMGAEPQTVLAIAVVPYGLEAKVESQLVQLMAGAAKVVRAAGAALVGGHTAEGAELALGFAVNGLADPARVLRKEGLRPGDALILTKALGTGTLFAADMRARAKGRWVEGALRSMLQSSGDAAKILMAHGARACTDVTGFGLLGHLVEMTKASGMDAEIEIGQLPVLDGAAECLAAGIFSSLQPANVRLRRALRDQDKAAAHPLYPLLFDPQTAGGLLAGVPDDKAEACLAALKAAGYDRAMRIGRVAARSDSPEPIRIVL